MDGPFKRLAKNLEELKLHGALDENLSMDDYGNSNFGVSATESSSLSNKKTLATVCNTEEQEDAEDEDKSPKKPSLSDVANVVYFIER